MTSQTSGLKFCVTSEKETAVVAAENKGNVERVVEEGGHKYQL